MNNIELLKKANTQLDGFESYVRQLDYLDYTISVNELKWNLDMYIAAIRRILNSLESVTPKE